MTEKIIKSGLILLIIIFLVMFFTSSGGYYEYQLSKKTTLTNESIKKFEKDLKTGKKIDINDYIKDNNKHYDNKVTRLGNNLSKGIDNIMSTGIKYIFEYLEKTIDLDK